MADFTFSLAQSPGLADLTPLYAHILGPGKAKPTVSLGVVSRADAEKWLRTQHQRYADSVGARSGLIQKLDIVKRVELVDLTDGVAD